jgi:hypothetical protein
MEEYMNRVTVTLEPWYGHTLTGNFKLGGGATVAGYCWQAVPSKMQTDGSFGPVTYRMREADGQGDQVGKIVKTFPDEAAIIAYMEESLNAPPRELTHDEACRTPGSAAWCESQGDNH